MILLAYLVHAHLVSCPGILRGQLVVSYSGRLSRSHPIPGAYIIRIIVAYQSHILHVIFITVSVYFTTMTAYIHFLVPLTKTGFIISTHKLNNVTRLTLVQATSEGSRRPISLMGTHTAIRAIRVSHPTACNY